MPPFARPDPLPPHLRELNEALHELHRLAGHPSARKVAGYINTGDFRTTATHEWVRRAFAMPLLPNWDLLEALVTVLSPQAGVDTAQQVERFRTLRLAAERSLAAPDRGDSAGARAPGEPGVGTGGESTMSAYPRNVDDVRSLPPLTSSWGTGGGTFAFSFTAAFTEQLGARLAESSPQPLGESNLDQLWSRPGIYELFHSGRLVYIGKASSDLPARLRLAARKISGRRGIDPRDVSFTHLYVDEDLSAIAPEALLLKRHGESPPWNRNGFGNSDPGRGRDASPVPEHHFDLLYPVNLDLPVPELIGERSIGGAAALLKRSLPYSFRYDRALKDDEAVLDFGENPPTAHSALAVLVEGLGAGWQATALPGHVIAYREDRDYPSALRTYRNSAVHGLAVYDR